MASVAAKSVLEDVDAPAVAVMRAATQALGEFLAWEPESIWLELKNQDIELPTSSRARLMAALTLRLVPSFYWDAITFEKTAIAFDGRLPNPDILEEASPACLAWAVVEAAWILKDAKDTSYEFGHEPRAYAGVILNRAGFVLAPTQLEFAQAALDHERRHEHLLVDVRRRWESVSKDHLEALSLQETPEDVQIARLAAVEMHVRDRRTAVARALARLA